jgi:hypothetical protein
MGTAKAVSELFEGRHFDRDVIILCACAGIFGSTLGNERQFPCLTFL